jgi:hypothetical protein
VVPGGQFISGLLLQDVPEIFNVVPCGHVNVLLLLVISFDIYIYKEKNEINIINKDTNT